MDEFDILHGDQWTPEETQKILAYERDRMNALSALWPKVVQEMLDNAERVTSAKPPC